MDYLEGVIQLMSNKLCQCRDHEVSSVLVEVGTEEPMVEEAEGSQLEYTEDDKYHTPEVEEVPLPVRELRLIESPSVEWLVNPFSEDECCRPRHPGVGWRSAGPSPALSEDESPVENIVPIPIRIQRSALVNPVRGQRSVRSAGPICSQPNIFYARHPYKPSGDHQGISLLSLNSASGTFGGVGPNRQGILMDTLSRGLRTRRVLQQMQQENEERMRVTALSVAREAGVELTEEEEGVLDV